MIKNILAFGMGFYLFFFFVFSAVYALESPRPSIDIEAKKTLEQQKLATDERRKEHMEKVQEQKEEFRTKVASLSSSMKQQQVERISQHFSVINTKFTDIMNQYVARLEELILHIEAHIERIAARGIDVSNATEILDQARVDLEELKPLIEQQKATDYTPVINTEATVRVDLKTTKDTLFEDLKEIRQKLVEIRQKLKNVVQELKKSSNQIIDKQSSGDRLKETTGSSVID